MNRIFSINFVYTTHLYELVSVRVTAYAVPF